MTTRSKLRLRRLGSLTVLAALTLAVYAEEKPPTVPKPAPPKTAPAKPAEKPKEHLPSPLTPVPKTERVKYVPPLRGTLSSDQPFRRRGGARGDGVSLIELEVIAPDQTGLTAQAQPTLYWYQSAPADVPSELSVLRENVPEPVLMVRRPDARAAGIQRVRLSDHGVELEPGVEYEWVVALVVDPENRSRDVVASGYIQYVATDDSAKAAAATSNLVDRAAAYAGRGFWYDAWDAIYQASAAQRADLLEQVGLTNVAHYAASTAPPN